MKNKQLEKVERLVPKLFKRVGYSFALITKRFIVQSGETFSFDALAREALWIATSEFKNETKILKRAGSLVVEWLKEDIQPQLRAEIYRKKAQRHPRPTIDPFSLPWGARVSEITINSGEKGPLGVAIDPTETDKSTIEKDSARYLFKIFSYVLEWWGPHTLAWLVLYMSNGSYTKTMEKLGETRKAYQQAIRTIPKIKTDITLNFKP